MQAQIEVRKKQNWHIKRLRITTKKVPKADLIRTTFEV